MPETQVLLLVGTAKGGFIFAGDAARRRWRVTGPVLAGWTVREMVWDPRSGMLLAACSHFSYGAVVARSADLGASWDHETRGLEGVRAVWTLLPADGDRPGVVYAGVEDAALYRSEDGGRSWEEVRGLREHPTAAQWQPGAGGQCLHTICLDPADRGRMYVAVSAGGAYRTDDGGATWRPINRGVRADFLPDPYPEAGQCVHRLALHPARPDVLYQQNHCGVYRSDDRGETWVDISEGLPSRFGFAIVVHPHDPDTVYTAPIASDERRLPPDGALAVWRSRDRGARWERLHRGLPQEHAYGIVLRQAMCSDGLDPAGLYLGTTSGEVYASADEGEHWTALAEHLPRILSVRAVAVPAA